jgi:COMPASS component SPP1
VYIHILPIAPFINILSFHSRLYNVCHCYESLINLTIFFFQYESQSSFGSIYKTRIEGNNMFCDYYNPSSRTYCKRLRVLCPEHSKDPKVNDTEVRRRFLCGWFGARTNEICSTDKC